MSDLRERLAEALAGLRLLGIDGLLPERILAADPALARRYELGEAWEAAEAALPEDRRITLFYHYGRGQWCAFAGLDPDQCGYGPTPTEALLALAARLREGA